MTDSFEAEVVAPVRAHLRHNVRLPSVGTWSMERERGTPLLHLTLSADQFGKNLQTNQAAAPFFLACFAYWLGQANKVEPRLHLEVVGAPPTTPHGLQHYRRAWIGLEAMQEALGERFSVTGAPARRWPQQPVLNAPREARATEAATDAAAEHQVEVQLTREPQHAAQFSELFSATTDFSRQLPLGLFESEVSQDTRWTPGGAAQADLWSTSPDGRTFHLFELKVAGNSPLGVLPELLTYLWLAHRVRIGLACGTQLRGGGKGAASLRAASRIAGWIVAPNVHPLLLSGGESPLEWFAKGLAGRIEFGIAPFDDGGDKRQFKAWRADGAWRQR